MRLHNLGKWGLDRIVVAKDGVTMNDGIHIPRGAKISVLSHAIHHDLTIYENPNEFDAFRYARLREDSTISDPAGSPDVSRNDDKTHLAQVLQQKNLSMVSTGPTHLPFGHGRHACPGRFLASLEVKLFLAQLVMNYDIKPLPERPANIWLGESMIPPTKATICIKRKTSVV